MNEAQLPDSAYINSIIGEGTRFNGELDLNGLLRIVLAAEAPLVARCGLPFGLTVVALARKPSA